MNEKTTLGSHLEPSRNYLIRTVTRDFTGHLEKIGKHELVLSTAAWITDIGRFDHIQTDADAFEGVEPIIGPLIINRHSIVDVIVIAELPMERKTKGHKPKPKPKPKKGH